MALFFVCSPIETLEIGKNLGRMMKYQQKNLTKPSEFSMAIDDKVSKKQFLASRWFQPI